MAVYNPFGDTLTEQFPLSLAELLGQAAPAAAPLPYVTQPGAFILPENATPPKAQAPEKKAEKPKQAALGTEAMKALQAMSAAPARLSPPGAVAPTHQSVKLSPELISSGPAINPLIAASLANILFGGKANG